jgi:hypothetical protein
MINQIVDGILAHLYDLIHGALTSLHIVIDPIYEWYAFGLLFFAACGVIGWFLPFKWVRAGLGVALLLVGAFIAGGVKMHTEMKEEIAKSKVKPKPATHKPAPQQEPSIFSQWW